MSYCNAGAKFPAGLLAYSKKAALQKYNSAWTKAYAVAPAGDGAYTPPQQGSVEDILKKRKFLEEYGTYLEAKPDTPTKQLGTAVRLYSRLVNPGHGTPSEHCFYLSGDLPNKKKMAQLERQSKAVFTGTGMTVVGKVN